MFYREMKGWRIMKIFWLTILIVLIPLWVILYVLGVIGLISSYLWDNVYYSVYKSAGSPLDKK